ncbi:MAG: arginine--tRNA ligase [Zoogloeaceae bacterium]|jgi:arginyl-tRNA synthetase|nr:arginine--tRNA ligase [Zoogloeaceae bacterium]
MPDPLVSDPRIVLTDLLRRALASVAPEAADMPVMLERPRNAAHGDFATNLAMQLAKRVKTNPRELAARLMAELPVSAWVKKVEIAGGFLNFTLDPLAKLGAVRAALAAGDDYGRSLQGGGRKVLLEFVSANPTGPLHVGHGRGAAYGASLADLLAFAGWDVTREYYVNDAGRQMDILALSTWLRYLGLRGVAVDLPPNAYQGDYVRKMAAVLSESRGDRYLRTAAETLEGVPELPAPEREDAAARHEREAHLDALIANGKKLLGEDWHAVHDYVLSEQLSDGRGDLEEFGVRFDVWFSEKALFDTGLVARSVARLEEAGHIYLQDGAKWFRSSNFGDEKDRVVQRENGLYTYFASDIAYHLNKYERGFERMINIWGADHHGYIPRVTGALRALNLEAERLDVALVQFAVLYRGGQKVSMSTRSGEFVTLRDLRQEVGNDACRFFYVLRKADQHLDFDLDLARSQSNENPVYYIQYAHARIASVFREWGGNPADLQAADLSPLSERELALASEIARFPEVIEAAAEDLSPHQVAFYLKDMATGFHAWYNAERILVADESVKNARLALAAATRQVIRNGMSILGVSCPDSM